MKITKEILEEAKNWYLKGNSIRKVAKLIQEKYGIKVGKETVRRHLSKAVKLRSKKEVMTMKRGNPLDEVKIVKLYTKGLLSMKQIAKSFNASASGIKWILLKNGIEPRSKREGIKIRIGKYKKPPFNGTKEEKAYLMGLTLGDLAVRSTSAFTIEVNTATTHKAMIDLLVNTFRKHTDGVVWYPDEKKGFRFCAYLDKSFDFLVESKKNVEMIKEFNKKEFLAFLAGFFDAEGCISKKKRKNSFRYEVTISNTNKRILEIIYERLKELDINSGICSSTHKGEYHSYNGKNVINRKDCYNLTVWRKNDILKFLHILDIRHEEKIKRKVECLKANL